MFTACDEDYEALIYDEFHLQVAEGDLNGPSRVDIARAVRNEAIRDVGLADLQRLTEQTMLYIRERRIPPPEYMLPVLALTGLITPFQ